MRDEYCEDGFGDVFVLEGAPHEKILVIYVL